MQTIKRTKNEKVAIGELVLFFAMLGVYIAPPVQAGKLGTRYEGPGLAEYLAADARRVASWWNRAEPDEKLYFLQELSPPAGWENRVAARWCDMTPRAQEYWQRAVSARCNKNLSELRRVNRETMAAGCEDARALAGAA